MIGHSPVAPEPDHPLSRLIRWSIRTLAEQHRTPTLVVPPFVTLRTSFFLSLAAAWQHSVCLEGPITSVHTNGGGLTMQWCAGPSFLNQTLGFSSPNAAFRAIWTSHVLRRHYPEFALKIERCWMPGRPTDDATSLVVAITSEANELPPWAATLRLSDFLAGHFDHQ